MNIAVVFTEWSSIQGDKHGENIYNWKHKGKTNKHLGQYAIKLPLKQLVCLWAKVIFIFHYWQVANNLDTVHDRESGIFC